MKKIIILTFILFSLTGCSYVELNELAIASAVGIDYEDNNYTLTAQIMNMKNTGNGAQEASALIYEASGETISTAIRNFAIRYPKTVYFGHLEIIVISDTAANKKLDDIFDYFIRSTEVRTSGFVAITKDEKAKDILNPSNEKKGSFPTEDIKSSLMGAAERNGTVTEVTLEEFASDYLKKGKDPIVPLIKTTESDPTAASKIIIENLIPVKSGKVFPTLDKTSSIAYNTINNNFYDVTMNIKYNNELTGVVIYNPKSSMDVKLENNKLTVNINIKVESKLYEINQKIDLAQGDSQDKIKNKVSNELKKYVQNLLDYCKNNNVDILGIGNLIYQDYYKEYDNYKNKNLYEEANFNIKITNNMYRHGNIDKGVA